MSEDTPAVSSFSVVSRNVRAEAADLGVLWVACTVLGLLYIWLVPIPPESKRPWMRMAVPVAFMVVFAFVAWSRGAHSKPKIADSLYFMGFLWTLMALIDALLSSPNPNSNLIYTAFGYSLIGTFSGMFLRLMLIQFARDLDDQREEAVDLIDSRIAELNAALLEVTSVTRQFGSTIAPLGERLQSELLKASLAWGQESKNIADGALVDVRTRLSSELQVITGVLGNFSSQCSEIVTVVERTKGDLVAPTQDLVQVAKQAATSIKRQAANLDAAFADLVKAVQLLPEDPELRTALVAARNELGSLTLAMSSTTTAVRNTQSALGTASEALGRTVSDAGAAAAALKNQSSDLSHAAQGATAASGALQAAVASARQDVDSVDRTLKEVVNFVDRHLAKK